MDGGDDCGKTCFDVDDAPSVPETPVSGAGAGSSSNAPVKFCGKCFMFWILVLGVAVAIMYASKGKWVLGQ